MTMGGWAAKAWPEKANDIATETTKMSVFIMVKFGLKSLTTYEE